MGRTFCERIPNRFRIEPIPRSSYRPVSGAVSAENASGLLPNSSESVLNGSTRGWLGLSRDSWRTLSLCSPQAFPGRWAPELGTPLDGRLSRVRDCSGSSEPISRNWFGAGSELIRGPILNCPAHERYRGLRCLSQACQCRFGTDSETACSCSGSSIPAANGTCLMPASAQREHTVQALFGNSSEIRNPLGVQLFSEKPGPTGRESTRP